MTYQNPYEMAELSDDRIKTIHDEVKLIGSSGRGRGDLLGRLLSVVIILGAILSLIIGQ
jgi:hypothetical protein